MSGFSVDELLQKDFSPRTRSQLVFTINEGYRLLDEEIQKADFLKEESARKSYGHLRNTMIDIVTKKQIELGNLPFSYRQEKVRGYTYIVLQSKFADLTISKVQTPSGLPPKAKNRGFRSQKNNQLHSQLDIFNLEEELKQKLVRPNDYYVILTHGGTQLDKPSFIRLGAIDESQNHWIGQQLDLTNVFTMVQTPSKKQDDDDIKLEFRKIVRDQNKNAEGE
ncbi:hypothetical protein [Terribacillus saccharophilus]|uniref:hypothetical protein n=1 Tax=Terribacillus saccharophilus TaxID=361277 RepID=UPI003D2A5C7E